MSALICAANDFGVVHATTHIPSHGTLANTKVCHLQSATHVSEHGSSGRFAQLCANLDDGQDRISPIDENLNFGD